MATLALSPLDSYRPAVEAVDDLEWLCNEAPVEMGEGSPLGDILEKAAIKHEWIAPTKGDPDGHYGKSYGAGRWEEWVAAPWAPENDAGEHTGERGYTRGIWAERPHQTRSSTLIEFSVAQIQAASMARNLAEVLAQMPARLCSVALTRHAPRAHGPKMREVFGGVVRIVHLSTSARASYVEANPGEGTLYSWLEGLAIRVSRSKPKAGETRVVSEARSEMTRELAAAYCAFEDARATLPRGRRYPHQRAARVLGRIGGGR